MDIDGIKRRMLVKYPAFGSVVANLKYVEAKDCGTAATDGESVYYNPEFVNNLTDDEQVFLFAHEVCHVAFNHILRSEGKDKRLWNIATDAVINALLQEDGLKMVKGGVDMPEAVEYDVEQMYEKLLADKQEQNHEKDTESSGNSESRNNQESSNGSSGNKNSEKGNNQSPKGRNNKDEKSNSSKNQSEAQNQLDGDKEESNQDVGHASHNLWDEAIKKAKSDAHKKESILDKVFNRNKEKKNEDHKKDKQVDNTSDGEKEKREQIERLAKEGERKGFSKNKIDRKRQLDELREALARQSVGYGNDTNSIGRDVGEIGKASPLVDWRRLLKEVVNANIDWSYKNADIEDGVVTPRLEELPRPETEILLDTSGSIHETLLRNFLRECKNILYESNVKVGCFDTEFYGFKEVRSEKDIENMGFQGGGGTDFNVAINAFSRRVENKIIFTDGEAPMPRKSMDAIWVVFGERNINPKGGRVISITRRQLERLYRYYDKDTER